MNRRRIVIVTGWGECEKSLSVLDFFKDQGGEIHIGTLEPGSREAIRLRREAINTPGVFGDNRKITGFPFTLVLDQSLGIVWAGAEPSDGDLLDAILTATEGLVSN